jgi:hypothetical protein
VIGIGAWRAGVIDEGEGAADRLLRPNFFLSEFAYAVFDIGRH